MTAGKDSRHQTSPVTKKQFESLVRAATDAILGVDHQGNITIWNAAATKMFGYKAKEAIDMSLHDLLVPGQMLAKANKGFEGFVETGQGPLVGKATECIALRKDGSEFPVELSISSFKQDDHWHATGIVRDITERRQAEERMRIEKKRLEVSLTLNKMNEAEEREILDYILEECVTITQSRFSFVGLMSKDESVLHVHAWSKGVMAECDVAEKGLSFPIAKAGIWAEPVRQRKPVIINDLAKAHPQKRSYPQGHVEIRSYLGVPVFELDHLTLLVSVANKAEQYTEYDVSGLYNLILDAWQLIKRRRIEESLKKKYEEIERMNQLMVGRELKMEELRKEIRRLKDAASS